MTAVKNLLRKIWQGLKSMSFAQWVITLLLLANLSISNEVLLSSREASDYASSAASEARDAKSAANDAESAAKDAASTASDAEDAAREAANSASNCR